ncbi:hypothetical protein ACOMHN_006123 [Nucella lapillus]
MKHNRGPKLASVDTAFELVRSNTEAREGEQFVQSEGQESGEGGEEFWAPSPATSVSSLSSLSDSEEEGEEFMTSFIVSSVSSPSVQVADLQSPGDLPGEPESTADSSARPAAPEEEDLLDYEEEMALQLPQEECLDMGWDWQVHLIAFCQKLAADTQCLENLAMCRKTATYTMTHGVAADFRDNLCERLRKTHFSLNIDEATNNSNNKVVNVLVRYFNDEKGVVITQLLGSFIENVATAQNIFAGLMSLIEPLEPAKCLPKENIVSCLMDNCNVMRGKKGGLETLIRDEQPHLLDVHGDTVHIVSNAAKEFCKPFSNYLEGFASDVYYDFKLSPKATELFMEVCSLLHVEGAVRPIRPVGSRFLQMLDVSERLHKILDPLMVFQYAFLTI